MNSYQFFPKQEYTLKDTEKNHNIVEIRDHGQVIFYFSFNRFDDFIDI